MLPTEVLPTFEDVYSGKYIKSKQVKREGDWCYLLKPGRNPPRVTDLILVKNCELFFKHEIYTDQHNGVDIRFPGDSHYHHGHMKVYIHEDRWEKFTEVHKYDKITIIGKIYKVSECSWSLKLCDVMKNDPDEEEEKPKTGCSIF